MTSECKATTPERAHVPVMVDAVLAALAPRDGEAFLDGTFGGGGHAAALLRAAHCSVWGVDRDSDAVSRGAELVREYPNRLRVLEGRFSEMASLLADHGVSGIDGVTLDLGISTFQLDDPARGFSFQADGPLDMRMGQEGRSAADVVNAEDEVTLRHLISTYGEERHAGRIARAIVSSRANSPIHTTRELADLIVRAMPSGPRRRHGDIHPATRTFQALRICVNDEIEELKRGLVAAERLLNPQGRLAVVSFHSLEDREVKRFLEARSSSRPGPSRHLPQSPEHSAPATFELLFRGVRRPTNNEIAANPRARSARMRAAVRTYAPGSRLEVSA